MFSYGFSRLAVLALGLAFVVLPTLRTQPLEAADFRVENEVFLVGQEKPIASSTTVFHGHEVYDFLDEPAETVIFDRKTRLFVILDVKRRISTELSAKQVTSFVEQLQQRAEKSPQPLIRFSAKPQFNETLDQQTGQLTLSSRWITYRLTLEKHKETTIPLRYGEFSDWYSRLNTVMNPGSRPPAARLAVNAAMASRGATASEVHLTLVTSESASAKPTKLRSQHKLTRGLTQNDEDRMAAVEQQLKTFRRVKFEQYRGK